ncbi:MAG: type II toxin-antitoxin system VapC family toxin [Bosea sp.]|uniref:type II toxin-antitoxin system VapC family toxin n=1 Tax=Bosea sp. (in: a-proteobacteria) TaxID=1871050 RepID=UPI00239D7A8F|nr:type II toxin-antitoxin system VapC family toxin [Bosea sp. (in: a-proteobacteria)]MCP4735622.1 type II toxin-antitoxin system VapC family toxin [Bosea sp. (in: a-proteobacteria)]
MLCLDTNVIVFAINGRVPAVEQRLRQELAAGTTLLIPSIVLFELRYGIAKSVRREASTRVLDAFLAEGFELLPFDDDDAAEAGDIRAALEASGTPIGAYDTLIAAQARRRGVVLVTGNRREFERVPGLMVTDWAG